MSSSGVQLHLSLCVGSHGGPRLDLGHLAWARRFVVRTVFPWVASRSRTPAKLQYEPLVGIRQHGYEYAPLNTACSTDWLPTENTVLVLDLDLVGTRVAAVYAPAHTAQSDWPF